jgi:hypothetical protein
MSKKICSILLSSLLAFSVSNKKSDAGLLNSIFKFTGSSLFLGAFALANYAAYDSYVPAKPGEYAGHIREGGVSFYEAHTGLLPCYIFGNLIYSIGEFGEVYDNNNGNNKGNKDENKRGEESKDFSLLNEYKNRAKNKK